MNTSVFDRNKPESHAVLVFPPKGDPILHIHWADGSIKRYKFRLMCEKLEELGVLVEAEG